MNKRDYSIDIMRAIALLGIIIVHNKPCSFVERLRDFDVPMMVFLSGVSFSYSQSYSSYPNYIKKRFVRLILPTWIFLSIYYGMIVIKDLLLGNGISIGLGTLAINYSLQTGWYVWIIRVFFFIALLAPFAAKMYSKLHPVSTIIVSLIGILSVELLPYNCNLIFKYFCITYPYIFIFGLGTTVRELEHRIVRRNILFFALLWLLQAIVLWIKNGEYTLTGLYKYPPRIYYVCYALFIIYLLWYYRQSIVHFLEKTNLLSIITWGGAHTIWIYFWHIIALYLIKSRMDYPYIIRFLFVLSFGVAMAYLQTIIVNSICRRIKSPKKIKLFRMIFIG